MKESFVIKFLYKTFVGRCLLKILVNPCISRASAGFLASPFSRWLVPVFVRINKIDMRYYQMPEGGYKSFNDFFTRKKKEKYICHNTGELISPCDGLLTVSDIDENNVFHIKHTDYSLSELLCDNSLAKEFTGGTAFIFRLTPAHFHRYTWSVSGCLAESRHIDGVLHSVQPVCHEKEKVFIQNSREYSWIIVPTAGEVIQMEIGALLVGRISNHNAEQGEVVCAGEEKGFFEYGGSSIVVLTNKKNKLSEELSQRERIGTEIPVAIGERLV